MIESQSDIDHCRNLVRQHDRLRFLTGLFLPEKLRGAYYAIAALQCELKRIPFAVSETLLGEIRFQWWRDGLSAPTGGGEHPILSGLLPHLDDDGRILALRVVDGYARCLDAVAPLNAGEWDHQALEQDGAVMRLVARVAGADDAIDADLIAVTSKIIHRVDCLRFFSIDAAEGVYRLPVDQLAEHEIDIGTLKRGGQRDEVRDLLLDLCNGMQPLMREAQVRAQILTRDQLALLLPVKACAIWLNRELRNSFDPYGLDPDVPSYRLQLGMLRAIALRRL